MYTDIETAVVNNGHIGKFFKPSRGIRQGCPISANIFIIIVEFLANAIRNNNSITGIKIAGVEFKISQYADDTVLYLNDQHSLQVVLLMLDIFYKCSGLKMNRDKSEAMWIGASSNFRHKPYGLKWTDVLVKTLGIYVGQNKQEMLKANFLEKLDKIENLISIWKKRNLTIKGKVLITNTYLLPQFLYAGTVLEVPNWAIEKYQLLIKDFISDSKPPKVKYNTLINTIANGGLKLQHLPTKLQAIKLKWIKMMQNPEYQAPWKAYLCSYFSGEPNLIFTYNMEKKDYPCFGDNFYASICETWAQVHYQNPIGPLAICEQIIWSNSNIRVNDKPINLKYCYDKGLVTIQNLINHKGKIGTKAEIENKFGIKFKQLDYESLYTAIPHKWKKEIEGCNVASNFSINIKCQLHLGTDRRDLEEIDTKKLYEAITDKIRLRPTSEERWYQTTELDLTQQEWEDIYTRPYELTRDSKLITFNYKVTHRTLACGKTLHKWKVRESPTCNICNEQEDTIEHHLVLCRKTNIFWNMLTNWWRSITDVYFPLDLYETLFGIPNPNNDIVITRLNLLLLCGNYYVYANKKKEKELCFYEFLHEFKDRLILMRHYMYAQNLQDKFENKWGLIIDNI
jgi:hypothetical protein